MNEYEITYLSSPQLSDEARAELDGTVDTLLGTLAATTTHSDPATRRRLFYPIQKQTAGFSRTVNVSLDPARVSELRATLHKQAGILRTAIIQTPRREEVTTAIFESIDQAEKPARPKVAAAAPKKPRVTKEVTMAEVEEKIEEALDEEVK